VKYAFIERHRKTFRVERMCSVLDVSRSGYYEWRDRPESRRCQADRGLLHDIREVHLQNREAYGAYKTWRVLNARGITCGRHRVARLRRQNGIEAKRKRRFRVVTAQQYTKAPPAPNLLAQQFDVHAPNRVWVADTTYVTTGTGWIFLAVVIDLHARKVVGWSMGARQTQELVLGALNMAIEHRSPQPGLIHHTDQGSTYTSSLYHAALHEIGAIPSMSRRGNAYDNAVVESFFSTLKNELIHHRRFTTREEARSEIFEYIEIFYHRQRAHASLHYMSPVEYELAHQCAG